jgi:hypothetical protein
MRQRALTSPFAPSSLLIGLALCAVFGSTASTLTVETPSLGVRFTVPEHCQTQEGPGTIEAVCDPSGDAAKSAIISAASSLFLEVVMQEVPQDRDQPPPALAERYPLSQFEKDLPLAVCGAEAKVKIENAAQLFQETRVVYTATVLCPEVRFLGLNQRRSIVRTIVGPGRRYQIQARAQVEDFERAKPVIDAFLASVRLEPEQRP